MAPDLREQLQASLGDTHTIERELGGGGMSRTYVSLERALSRRVVIKVLSPELSAGVSVERFKREILLAAQLQHPHIVPVIASGDTNGLPWFTMPYVEGESLRQRLAREPMGIGEATGILKDVARALEFAHARGVVHRDIKPDNVLLAGSSATVTDFGIAKAISAARTGDGAATLTQAGTSIGTPAYMAPEQAAGDPDTDHRADLYSFGCMAYEALTGHPPFEATSPAKLLGAHLGETARDVRELRPDAPASLAALVMRCLEKDPGDRPPAASDLVRVLDAVTSSGGAPSAPAILAGRIHVGKALGLWVAAAALVALTAWAATVVIGLPDWVLPGAIGVMLAGLPIIGLTAWVQHVAHRAYTATPTYTPGGTAATTRGTMHTIAIKASPHVSWRRTWMGGAIAVAAFVVLVVGWMVLRALGIGPAGSLVGAGELSAQEQILVTDFRSPADDSTLGVTVAEALRGDLAQSSMLRVMPRLAVIEDLRLMRLPADSRIDFDLARTIATREGIKAVLDGEIVSLGGRYALTTSLVSAQGGRQLAVFREEAANQNDLIPAISRLSKKLRAKAGESLKDVRAATAFDRVTTGSMEALRKYVAGNLLVTETGDQLGAIGQFEEAVAIDSTFSMAWRRLAQYYANAGRFEKAREAAIHAFRNADRLSETERQLTTATYYTLGPDADDEKALAAYRAVLSRDSLNYIALNNAAANLRYRHRWEEAATYYLKAVRQPGATSVGWGSAAGVLVRLGRWEALDTLLNDWRTRSPGNPLPFGYSAVAAAARGDFDSAERLMQEGGSRFEGSGSRTALGAYLDFSASLAAARGQLRKSATLRDYARAQSAAPNSADARLDAGVDSAMLAALVREDPATGRSILDRALRRAPIDSIPVLEQDFGPYLVLAAFTGDSVRARAWRTAARSRWQALGDIANRPANEALDDAGLAIAERRYADALARLDDAERRGLDRTDELAALRFVATDRMALPDSAIAAGEAYLTVTHPSRISIDGYVRAGILQRLGELYEQKGDTDKALEHYNAFVALWKDADPELQPRMRDVRQRVARLQRGRG